MVAKVLETPLLAAWIRVFISELSMLQILKHFLEDTKIPNMLLWLLKFPQVDSQALA